MKKGKMSYSSRYRPCHSVWSDADAETLRKAILAVRAYLFQKIQKEMMMQNIYSILCPYIKFGLWGKLSVCKGMNCPHCCP